MKHIIKTVTAECYFRTHLGLYCPGCGGTRAFFALLGGHFLQSLKYNPITLLFLVDIFLNLLKLILVHRQRKNGRSSKITTVNFYYNVGFLLFIVIYFIVRNILLCFCGIDITGDFR